MPYAATTDVPADRSRAQLEQLLRAAGATQFMYGWTDDGTAAGPDSSAVVQFMAHGRLIRFVVPFPRPDSPEFTKTPTGQRRAAKAAAAAWEQATRSRWRALLLVVRAKLEAVEVGISTFEREFLAHTVLPDDRTVDEWLGPQLTQAYASGAMPSSGLPLALGPGS